MPNRYIKQAHKRTCMNNSTIIHNNHKLEITPLFVNSRADKLTYIHTMQNHIATKRNKLQLCTILCLNFTNMMLKRSQKKRSPTTSFNLFTVKNKQNISCYMLGEQLP